MSRTLSTSFAAFGTAAIGTARWSGFQAAMLSGVPQVKILCKARSMQGVSAAVATAPQQSSQALMRQQHEVERVTAPPRSKSRTQTRNTSSDIALVVHDALLCCFWQTPDQSSHSPMRPSVPRGTHRGHSQRSPPPSSMSRHRLTGWPQSCH